MNRIMNATLEFDQMPASFEPETMTVHSNLVPIEPGQMVTVCSWCDDQKLLTGQLIRAGYEVSHGLCVRCSKGVFRP